MNSKDSKEALQSGPGDWSQELHQEQADQGYTCSYIFLLVYAHGLLIGCYAYSVFTMS